MTEPENLPPAPGAPSAEAPSHAEPPSVLLHSRAPRRVSAWLGIALPVVGLLVVPTVGLVYAAVGSFGLEADKPASDGSGEGAAEGDDETSGDEKAASNGAKSTKGKAKRKLPKGSKGSSKPRTDSAALCCAKLRELGKTAPMESRPAYLAAASACDGADDPESAIARVTSQLGVSGADVPPECEK